MIRKHLIPKIMILIVILFCILTGYFYMQHQYSVETWYLDTYIEYETYDMYVISLSRYTCERDYSSLFFEGSSMTEWVYSSRLPNDVKMAYLYLRSFYNTPYAFYEEGQSRYELRAVILTRDEADHSEMWRNNKKKVKVSLSDLSSGALRSSLSGGSHSKDLANYFFVDFSVDWWKEGVDQLLISNAEEGIYTEFDLNDAPIVNRYNYFDREKEEADLTANNPVEDLIRRYHYDSMEGASDYIHPAYLETFNWAALDKVTQADPEIASITYIGQYDSFEHVFRMDVVEASKGVSLLIVFDDGRWLVLGE